MDWAREGGARTRCPVVKTKEGTMVRGLQIVPVLNGWLVTMGCQQIVFVSLARMCGEIQRYYESPARVEREYLENAVNATPQEQRVTTETTLEPREDWTSVAQAGTPERGRRGLD
jgi:hypothetical protein